MLAAPNKWTVYKPSQVEGRRSSLMSCTTFSIALPEDVGQQAKFFSTSSLHSGLET